jgi:hypothetical protein
VTCYEMLREKAEQESFNKNVLQDLEKLKGKLAKKLRSLKIQGFFHRAKQAEAQLEVLEKTIESMKRVLEHGETEDVRLWHGLFKVKIVKHFNDGRCMVEALEGYGGRSKGDSWITLPMFLYKIVKEP